MGAGGGGGVPTAKPGDVILHRGEPKTVTGVAVYLVLGVEPWREVA